MNPGAHQHIIELYIKATLRKLRMVFLRYRFLELHSITDHASFDDDDEALWYSMVINMDDYEASESLLMHSSSQNNSTIPLSTTGSNGWKLMSGSTEDIVVSCLIIIIIILSLIIIYVWVRSEITHSKRMRLRRSGSIRDQMNKSKRTLV